MESIEEVIKGCLKNKRNAQKHLYEMFSAKMYGTCMRYAKNHQDAQDILHDGFIIVFEKIHTFQNKGSFEGWIRRIIINTAIKKYRERISHLEITSLDNSYKENDELKTTHDRLQLEDLIKTIQSLPSKYRLVFNMYAVEGYSHKEISNILNISDNTSRTNYLRARVILQEKLKEEENVSDAPIVAIK